MISTPAREGAARFEWIRIRRGGRFSKRSQGGQCVSESAHNGEAILLHSARQLLTLRGPAGPRRGPEMQDLGLIPDGAVLIRDGVVEDIGPTRRVANLVRSRRAREIDATGHVVLPAFVDPDAPLVTQALSSGQRAWVEKGGPATEPLRVMSRRRMEMRSATMAQTLASYGVLVTGSSTGSAEDLKNAMRILGVQKEMQGTPVRIQSVLAWPGGRHDNSEHSEKNLLDWLNAIRTRDLASIVEFTTSASDFNRLRAAAQVAMQRGFAVRFSVGGALDPATVELALACGAVAVHGLPAQANSALSELARANCVFVVPCADLMDYDPGRTNVARAAIDSGLPVAIASAFRTGVPASLNMQFNLYLACARLGLTPEQAITAATFNAASALRLAGSAGLLAPGLPADLVMMDVPDYRELILHAGHHDVLTVMRAGRAIYRRAPLTAD